MDLITVDVTDAPQSAAHPGAFMEVLGDDYTIDDAADAAGAIGYEFSQSRRTLPPQLSRRRWLSGWAPGADGVGGGADEPARRDWPGLSRFLAATGRLALFTSSAVSHWSARRSISRSGRQLVEIGFYSLPVVGLTTLTGMVLALQSYTGFSRFNAESAIASVVVAVDHAELSPVLAGLMVAGRIGASMAAEIGAMRVTEQIDALTTLSTNPMKYLVVPRLLAAVIAMPLLVLVGDVIGVFGGYIVAIYKLDFNAASYIRNTVEYLEVMDVVWAS